jgi:hypothetical protein
MSLLYYRIESPFKICIKWDIWIVKQCTALFSIKSDFESEHKKTRRGTELSRRDSETSPAGFESFVIYHLQTHGVA